MAMLPEVHVTLDRPTIQHIYQLFLPFVPGCTLVVGLALAHHSLSPLGAATTLGRYSRIGVAAFGAYITGLTLYALSFYFGSILSVIASNLCFRVQKCRPFRKNLTTSQNHVWRTVAATFLGNQLTPPPPAVPGSGLTTSSLQFTSPPPIPPSVLQHDVDWNDWYNVLQDYVLRGTYILPADTLFFWTIIQATCWAFVFLLLHLGLGGNWYLAIPVSLVMLTALLPFGAVYTYFKYDRLTAADFTARLLIEIRK